MSIVSARYFYIIAEIFLLMLGFGSMPRTRGSSGAVHNLIARHHQKVESADGIVALRFRRFEPLLDLFGKFVINYALTYGCHKIRQSIIATKNGK